MEATPSSFQPWGEGVLAGLIVLALSTAAAPPEPTGVNGSLLGKAEDFSFRGPGKACFADAAFEIGAEETAYLAYSGIHILRIEVRGPKGSLTFDLGDSWKRPKRPRKPLIERADLRVVKVGNDTEFRYLVYARNEYSRDNFVPAIWVDGSALRGDSSDKDIFSRLAVGAHSIDKCGITYDYGWDVLINGDPLVTRPAAANK